MGAPYVANGQCHAVAQDISLRCDPIVCEEGISEEGWEIFSQLVNHVQEGLLRGAALEKRKVPILACLKEQNSGVEEVGCR